MDVVIHGFVYGTRAGVGGLGLQAATAVAGLAARGPVVALGRGYARDWPLETPAPAVVWEESSPFRPSWFTRQVVRRFRAGRLVLTHDRQVGRWAAGRLAALQPGRLYAFTQVGLEALEWAKANGVPTILDSPNGHIRGFAEVYQAEWARWVGGRFPGHPTDEMISRVEQEYMLADRIRVSSEWAKRSMVVGEFLQIRSSSAPNPSTEGGSVPRVPPTRHSDHSGSATSGRSMCEKGSSASFGRSGGSVPIGCGSRSSEGLAIAAPGGCSLGSGPAWTSRSR